MHGTANSIPPPPPPVFDKQADGAYTAVGRRHFYRIESRGGHYVALCDGQNVRQKPGLTGYQHLAAAKRACQRQEVPA